MTDFKRRLLLQGVLATAVSALGGGSYAAETTTLDRAQSRIFRAWLIRIVRAQLDQGPTPRWQHRDCAGLVRFAVAESLRSHDQKWKLSMGLAGSVLPPELDLTRIQLDALRYNWRLADGSRAAYAGALELVQENARLISRQWQQALPGDLLFFDQGDDQHLMVWMGRYLAYHTGSTWPGDNGLRAADIKELLDWKDTRWQPVQFNPNFAGIYRFSFLSDT
jgi:uncharacterized protein YfaT (DUF1175 family)